jgi:hypothetical protein
MRATKSVRTESLAGLLGSQNINPHSIKFESEPQAVANALSRLVNCGDAARYRSPY